jgi:hypothetical protein
MPLYLERIGFERRRICAVCEAGDLVIALVD